MQKALLKVKDVQKTLPKRVKCKEGQGKINKKRIYEEKISGKKASMKEKCLQQHHLWQESRFKKASMKGKHR